MNENEKIVSSANYKIVDASPELAKADLQAPASGTDITNLIHQSRCCGGGCKKKN
jgi:hypothetical protein